MGPSLEWISKAIANESDWSSVDNCSAADMQVDALSDIITWGNDLWLANHLKAKEMFQ